MPVEIYFNDPSTIREWSSGKHYTYMGVADADGHLLFSNRDWYEMTPFANGRAFVKDSKERWWLIDRNGKQVGDRSFVSVLFDRKYAKPPALFENNRAFVETEEDTWTAIDSNGRVVLASRDFSDYGNYHLYRRGNTIVLQKDISTGGSGYSYSYGFWNVADSVFLEPRYHDLDEGAQRGLRYASENGLMVYLDRSGRERWRETEDSLGLSTLNIDFMNRGYFYAAAPYVESLDGAGGHGGSENKPEAAPEGAGAGLQVLADTGAVLWRDTYRGMRARIVNGGKDTVVFSAQDSRLPMLVQALDASGTWRNIEYLPSSWCGNSYHTLHLPPGKQWNFVMPRYEGAFRTRFRLILQVQDRRYDRKQHPVYSNEWEGSVNPGQFWNKRAYRRGGIMDPYND